MVFVEIFRMMLVIAGVVGGLQVGDHIGRDSTAPLVVATLATLVAYVAGGILGRMIDRGLRGAVVGLRDMPPAEVFAGSVVGTTGLLLGVALGLAVLDLAHRAVVAPLAAALAWVMCAAGVRLGVAKGQQVARAAGLDYLVEKPGDPGDAALVIDTSALLERQLVVLARSGLLAGGVVVPRAVLDEAHVLAESPDPVASRRARAGIETVDELRRMGVTVHVPDDELPGADTAVDKVMVLARRHRYRVATCSPEVVARAGDAGLGAVNLRQLSADLSQGHVAGERMVVDLVRAGSQQGQAVGYTPDGDMIVVNEAGHLVGHDAVTVVVSGTRPTSQGTIVFAQVDPALAPAPAGLT